MGSSPESGALSASPSTGHGSREQEPATLAPVSGSSSTPPPEEPVFPAAGWERYQPVRFLGQGGMGQVFLAYDPRLRRNVALKFMRERDPELARRFVSEARAQARVNHERVCKVYEVGEVHGMAYIAMQYVEGQPLNILAPQLTLEQKVLLVCQAAEGLHAAHRAGLIHRDVKPSNILVERTEEGLKPYVMDFGLARDRREEITATSAVMGTPHYMAPEQARGELARLDRRVDVYGLGATLYTVLSGQPPFRGSNTLEVLNLIQSQEPRPLRAQEPSIPPDLEAITLKCLEKESSARYGSARALAEDLERFLAGEPVVARPVNAWSRLLRRVRKHRLAVALGASALLVVALALGKAALTQRESGVRERLSRRFAEQVEQVEAVARYSALAPLHDTRADRQALRQRLDALQSEVNEAGQVGLGPGNYALGRGWLALGEVQQARQYLESSWQHWREPRVAHALALVWGRLYQQQLREAQRLSDPQQRQARRREVEQHYREPALQWLRQGTSAEVPSPPQYVAALLAYYEGRLEEALAQLDSLGSTLPWFYEAPLLRGDILLALASQQGEHGERAQALERLEAGRKAYATAAAIGESAPEVYLSLARLELEELYLQLYAQGDVQPPGERGLQALAHARAAAPEDYEAHVLTASFYRRLAEYQITHGTEAQPLLDKALEAARQAQALEPARPQARLEGALILHQWARQRQHRGQDPRAQLQEALQSLEQLGPEHRDASFHTVRGLLYKVQARYAELIGEDPRPDWDQAISSYQATLALEERQAETWINLGAAYLQRATSSHGRSPEGDLERALEALERAWALDPGSYATCFFQGDVHLQRARRLRDTGGEAGPELERALQLYRQGLAINRRFSHFHDSIATVLLLQAEQAWEQGGNPEILLSQAQAALEQSLAMVPQGSTYNNLGELYVQRAVYRRAGGEDPGPSAQAAIHYLRKALEQLPEHPQPWLHLGRAHYTQAAWALDRGHSPQPALDEAQQALRRALQLNPRYAEAWQSLGQVYAIHALWLAAQGHARDEHFEQAAQAFQQALELEPSRLSCQVDAGQLYLGWASSRQQVGGAPGPLLQQGLDQVQAVLTSRPEWTQARLVRASLLWSLAEVSTPPQPELRRHAQQERELALARNPHLAWAWRSLAPLRRFTPQPRYRISAK